MSEIDYQKENFTVLTDVDTTCEQIIKNANIDSKKFSAKDLFDLQENGIYVNRKSIYSRYNDENKKRCNSNENDVSNMNVVKFGTKIKIKRNCFIDETGNFINLTTLAEYNLNQLNNMIKVFWHDKAKELIKKDTLSLKNHFYQKSNDIAYVLLVRKVLKGKVKEGKIFDGIDVDFEIMDLTPYLVSTQTGVQNFGGRFVLTLPPILGEIVKHDENDIQWEMFGDIINIAKNKDNFQHFYIKSNLRYNYHKDVLSDSGEILDKGKYGWYFEKIINTNDLIVIKFDEPFIRTDKIGNGRFGDEDTFDMIGLVDTVGKREVVNAEGSYDLQVQVNGRDLSKLLIEDGTYFYPNAFTAFGDGEDTKNKKEKEVKQQKFPQYFANYKATDSDTNKTSQFFSHRKIAERIFGQIPYLQSKKYMRVNDFVRDIIKMLSILNIQVGEKNIGTANSSFAFESILDKDNGQLVFTGNIDKATIWNFVELYTDEENDLQRNRVVYDDSITTTSGSIISFLQRLCQPPFVELFADTWFEKYSIIVRQPPLTIESYLDNITIEVGDEHLISESTMYDDSKSFSWFRLDPVGLFYREPNLKLIDFPAVLLDDFASVFGSKKREYTSNYLGTERTTEKNNDSPNIKDATYAQATGDTIMLLKGLSIEPFMKRGTVETYGNRMIRRGMNLYLKDRDMLYYVESVQQYSAIDQRKTTVNVSRGIRKADWETYAKLLKINDISKTDDTKMKNESRNKEEKGELGAVGKSLYHKQLSSIKVDRNLFLKLLLKKPYNTDEL